jgi:DNA-binding transcriptional LysR family regulator
MDLRHLETFVTVAELKSFTKAGEKLYLTQPTVSKQIVDLERFFDIRLLDRSKRYVALTKAGELLLGYARELLSMKRELVDAVDAFKGLKRGTIHIGASNIPGIYVLPRLLSAFKKQYGGVDVRLTVTDTRNTLGGLEEGSFDLGFVGAKGSTKTLEYRRIAEDIIVMIAPPGHPRRITMEEFGHQPLIVRERGSGTREIFERALAKVSQVKAEPPALNIVAELSDTEAIKQSVKNGLGISYISNMAIKEEVGREALEVLAVDGFPRMARPLYVATKKGRTLLPQAKALIEILQNWRRDEER